MEFILSWFIILFVWNIFFCDVKFWNIIYFWSNLKGIKSHFFKNSIFYLLSNIHLGLKDMVVM